MLIDIVCPACSKRFYTKRHLVFRRGKTLENPPCCSRSCAAKVRDPGSITHGHSRGGKLTKEFTAWRQMRRRCNSKEDKSYVRYGGRGVKVCKRWDSFEDFLSDVGYAPSNKHSLGRIDNDGDYEPANVEWQLPETQANNKSTSRAITAFGKTQTLQQWANEYDIDRSCLSTRLDCYRWTPEEAISTPSMGRPAKHERLLTFSGKTMNIRDWSRRIEISETAIAYRLKIGWPIERVLTERPRWNTRKGAANPSTDLQ
jgi:hypothetical protein